MQMLNSAVADGGSRSTKYSGLLLSPLNHQVFFLSLSLADLWWSLLGQQWRDHMLLVLIHLHWAQILPHLKNWCTRMALEIQVNLFTDSILKLIWNEFVDTKLYLKWLWWNVIDLWLRATYVMVKWNFGGCYIYQDYYLQSTLYLQA